MHHAQHPRPPGSEHHPEQASFESAWRERFEEFASLRNDDAGIAGWSRTGLEVRIRRFVSLSRLRNDGERWLDAGCGAGTYTRLLHARGARVTGVDYSIQAIRKARERSSEAIGFAVADVRKLPFRRAWFDGLLCFGVMQALADNTLVINELSTLIAPGGSIWVDGLNRDCLVHTATILERKVQRRPAHLRYDRPYAVRNILRANGFNHVAVHWLPILPSRWQRLQRFVEHPFVSRMLRSMPLVARLVSHSFIICGEKPAAA